MFGRSHFRIKSALRTAVGAKEWIMVNIIQSQYLKTILVDSLFNQSNVQRSLIRRIVHLKVSVS